MNAIIFSKNRACQLHLLLESILLNSNSVFKHIFILYTAEGKFKQGYHKIKEIYPGFIWMDQSDFKEDTLDLINLCEKYICFFVDDNFLYRRIPMLGVELEGFFDNYPNIGCLSLRLGRNTVIQNWYTQSPMPMPQNIQVTHPNDIFTWNWQTMPANTNFGYPFSVDGHIYTKNMLLHGLNYDFNTPNALEGRFNINYVSNNICCFGQSILVNNPLNLVGSSENLAGQHFGISLEELNNKYLNGYKIDLCKLMENDIIASHQEMKIDFTQ